MGNTRNWTTKFNANNEAFHRLLKRNRITTPSRKKAAMERAATLPNRLPPIVRRARQEGA